MNEHNPDIKSHDAEDPLRQLYQEVILDHYRTPRNKGVVDESTHTSISQASASMMTERLKGRSISEALALDATFTRMLHGDADAAADEELGDLRALAGVAQFPVRVKCALLAWNCLEELVGPGS